MELESRRREFRERGLEVAALSYDSVEVLSDFTRRRGITFPLLSDPGSAVIRRFSLLDPAHPEGSKDHGLSLSGTLLLDRSGVVRERFFEASYDLRRTAGSILAHLGATPGEANEIRTDHFVLRASSSSAEVARGQRLTLVLDFEMAEGRHAYAPGAHRYRALEVRLDPSPLFTVHEAEYPPPHPYEFKPLREVVPVYEGRFRVLQDVTVVGEALDRLFRSGAPPELAVTGTLRYQVCTDTVCHRPDELPLSWTLRARPPDRERAPEAIRRPR